MAIQSLRVLPSIGLKNASEGSTYYNANWRHAYIRRIRLHPEKKNPDEDLVSEILEIQGVVSLIVTKKIDGDINVVVQKRDDASWDPIIQNVSLLLTQRSSDTTELLAESS